MAEGFARHYGSDVMEISSAGLPRAAFVAPLTKKVMMDRGIDVSQQYPKAIEDLPPAFEIVINMSGYPLPPNLNSKSRVWTVHDPIAGPEPVYLKVAEQIEDLVMKLVLELRRTA